MRYATAGPGAHAVRVLPTRTRSSGCTPSNPRFARLSSEDRLIVSEPFSDLPGLWHEIPQSSAVTVRHGGVLEHQAFTPRVPVSAAHG